MLCVQCIIELRDNTRFLKTYGFVPILDASATVYAGDNYVAEPTKQALRDGAARLENVPHEAQDWHPGSDGKVLDLVHPSLYPLVYGRTKALVDSEAETVPIPDEADCKIARERKDYWNIKYGEDPKAYSSKFQWLPCSVHFPTDSPDQVRIASYINNLHPTGNESLYTAIEQVIAKAIPMWSETLTSTQWSDRKPRITIDKIKLAESAKRPRPPAENEDELSEDDKIDLDGEWADEIYDIVPPEPGHYVPRSRIPTFAAPVDLRRDFATQGLQVIVKMANIHLTPSSPDYGGGTWHVEGQLNEHICASALYYYDSANITDSHLSFRERASGFELEQLPYEQGQYGWIEQHFGMQNDRPFTQELGKVETKEGRLLAFPNVLQHRVNPFRLANESKPGHRKLLALFLVDPYLRIPSTSVIPPQQKEWDAKAQDSDLLPQMPDDEASLMDLNEAKTLRLELMAERRARVEDVETPRLWETTNFCEH